MGFHTGTWCSGELHPGQERDAELLSKTRALFVVREGTKLPFQLLGLLGFLLWIKALPCGSS